MNRIIMLTLMLLLATNVLADATSSYKGYVTLHVNTFTNSGCYFGSGYTIPANTYLSDAEGDAETWLSEFFVPAFTHNACVNPDHPNSVNPQLTPTGDWGRASTASSQSANGMYGRNWNLTVTAPDGNHTYLFHIGYDVSCPNGGAVPTYGDQTYPGWCIINGEPPPDNTCSAYAGQTQWASVIVPPDATTIPTTSDGEYNGDHCEVRNNSVETCIPATNAQNVPDPTGNRFCLVSTTFTGDPSSAGLLASKAQSSNCVSTAVSTTCVDPDNKTNCGTYNGQSICMDTVPPGNCTFIPGGSYICSSSSDAALPPASVPDNGTDGTPATPSGSLTYTDSSGNTTTVNVYGSNVVGGSSNMGAGGGATPAVPYTPPVTDTGTVDALNTANTTLQDIKDDLDKQQQDTDTASGQPGPTLDNSLAPDMATSLSDFWTSLTTGPWAISLSGITLSEGGTCSAGGSFEVWGHSYDYSSICTMLDSDVAPILSIVMYVFWSIIAIKIFFS